MRSILSDQQEDERESKKAECNRFQVLIDYQGVAMDLSEDFTVAASNVITTLVFGKEVSVCHPCRIASPYELD